MSDLPPPPVSREAEVIARPEPKQPRGSWFAWASVIGALLLVAGIGVAGFLWLEPAADKRPSPVAEPERPAAPHIVAPSDAVVQEELEQQLALYQKSGGEAANQRLRSYRAGLQSAGCLVGLSHGVNFATEREAALAAKRFSESAREALTRKGATFGAGGVVATTDKGGVDYYVLYVACPPTPEAK